MVLLLFLDLDLGGSSADLAGVLIRGCYRPPNVLARRGELSARRLAPGGRWDCRRLSKRILKIGSSRGVA